MSSWKPETASGMEQIAQELIHTDQSRLFWLPLVRVAYGLMAPLKRFLIRLSKKVILYVLKEAGKVTVWTWPKNQF